MNTKKKKQQNKIKTYYFSLSRNRNLSKKKELYD